MKFGICLPIRRDTSIRFNIDLAVAAEKLGFDSVWASDHVVIPESVAGRFSQLFYDPLTTLAAIAACTSTLKIGTSVIILPYRNPVILAKSLSTLDNLSNGRLLFGIAAGWLEEEFDALKVPFKKRGELTDEYLEAIIELWTSEDPSYSGHHVDFGSIRFYPKPVQKPYPPVWIGGSGEKVLRRCAKYGDCWHPTWLGPEEMEQKIRKIKEYAEAAGRNTNEITYSIRNRIDLKKSKETYKSNNSIFVFHGSFEEIRRQVENFGEAGVDYIIFDPETDSDRENLEAAEMISEHVISKYK